VDPAQLYEHIARWEDLRTEFKEWPVAPDRLAASIVAFANTSGGQLVIGVANSRQVVGVADPDAVTRTVDNVAANNCMPPISVVQQILELSHEDVPGEPASKAVVIVRIPLGDMRPYSTNQGRYYVRTSSGRRQASREELLRLFQATESLFYDEVSLPNAMLADVDLDALERYLERTGQAELELDRKGLLVNWGLMTVEHPTVAGVLLFGRAPQRYLPYATVVAARFNGTDTSAEPADLKELDGRLLDVVDQAERFLDLHLTSQHTISGFESEVMPELPKEALREVIVNAVAHRDYTVRGPIRLFVLDDRVEVHTPGRPPNTVDEGAMRAGVHVLRNPHIYSRLADAGLVTRAGTGIRRTIRLVREATGRDVEIDIREYEVVFRLPRPRGAEHFAPEA